MYNKGGKRAGYIAPDEEMLKLINLYNRGEKYEETITGIIFSTGCSTNKCRVLF
ncbi:hypothetical protein PL321_02650 [Caloramator sp. mosi_1]|uniref:hypothetical protein n=1 Tax=Caloramator sp. mosi_1 TaxID=3023090 RepID=UPI002362E513|nr:hypothetical protein [Caloramator sp. mosi_1]WDC84623.1 hypothetical protein PL321_02650 [Caloramator sp. mosi_1]